MINEINNQNDYLLPTLFDFNSGKIKSKKYFKLKDCALPYIFMYKPYEPYNRIFTDKRKIKDSIKELIIKKGDEKYFIEILFLRFIYFYDLDIDDQSIEMFLDNICEE